MLKYIHFDFFKIFFKKVLTLKLCCGIIKNVDQIKGLQKQSTKNLPPFEKPN